MAYNQERIAEASEHLIDVLDEEGNPLDEIQAIINELQDLVTELTECHGHPSTHGPIGNVIFCDGKCRN